MEAETEKERSLQKKIKSGLCSCTRPGETAEADALFTDDLILEILIRLPARSLHRFKCVSVAWRDLIADPANRNKLPQALAGFLYMSFRSVHHHHHFASVSGGAAPFDPSLPYLQPNKYRDMEQVDACNGLLLYRACTKNLAPWDWSWTEDDCRFVVCNPATGSWVELPPQPQPQEPKGRNRIAGLAFDPAVSSHFHVLRFEEACSSSVTGVSIYSSRTGAWSHRDCVMAEEVTLFSRTRCVFVDGVLYLMGFLPRTNNDHVLLAVDMAGKVWKTISVPYARGFAMIGSSQGCLHYAIASFDDNNDILVSGIELWCLKDCDSKELVLKRTASIDKFTGMTTKNYRVIGIHPDCDTIFLVPCGGHTLVVHDMQHQKVGCILDLEKNSSTQRFLPYVPLFSESLADANGR
ncbi:F-box protein At5g07610-like [Triticum dicoccoides]|uniref:F-box protein At5g07610-like n=1 Tax=Triticum dicoccoides TaxID=85692 RepID=UPI000E787E4C|nr:F-box protein At5g07610-like [Triticum dicoccoides]